MAKSNDNYLTGKCLISMSSIEDERFFNTIIYICSHTKDGAMGFVLNKTINEFSFLDLANQLPITILQPIREISLHNGGPLEKVRGFVIHSTDYIQKDTIVIDESIAVSSSIDVIKDIAFGSGPKENIIALGYAAWAPKQLEEEIINNTWLVADGSTDLIFRTKDEDKWQKAIDSLGIDVSKIHKTTGHC